MATQRTSVQIDGLTSQNSERRIETALKDLPGMRSIKAHSPIDAVFIEYESSQFDWDRFDRQLNRVGYPRIDTTTTIIISAPELVCPSIVDNILSVLMDQPWIERIQIPPKLASIEISFDSRAWTEQEIIQMISDQTIHQGVARSR